MLKRVPVFLYLLMFVTLPLSYAKDMDHVLVAPQGKVQAGQDVIFTVYYSNLTNQSIISNTLYAQQTCLISNEKESVKKTAYPIAGINEKKTNIPGNGFKKVQYQVSIPGQMHGNIKIALSETDSNTAIFFAEKAAEKTAEAETPKVEQYSLNDASTKFQPYVENLSAYKPMYFLLGVDPGPEKSNFQISFKYRFFNEEGFLAEKAPWLTGFHFGYTQRSLWDMEADSAPFEDTSYMPELFYLIDKIDLDIPWISAFGVQTGFQHESNGNSGTDSRSTNYLYIKPIISFRLGGGYHWSLAPKLFAYVNNDDDTNPDIEDYRGYYELETKIGNPESFVLAGLFRNGDEGSSYQLDLSYPLSKLLGGSLNIFLHAQYYNGYAETLLHYTEKDDAFRLGISIVR